MEMEGEELHRSGQINGAQRAAFSSLQVYYLLVSLSLVYKN